MAHDVTFIPGDGTGPELAEATRRTLEATGVDFNWDRQEAGVDEYEAHGNPFPDATLDSLKRTGVGIKGPTTTPVGSGFRSVNVLLRKELDLYACIRPCKAYEGVRTRFPETDLVIVRENTEDLYAGIEFERGSDDNAALREKLAELGELLAQGRVVIRAALELDARVEILGVLAHDHEVCLGKARPHAFVGLAGPDAGIQIQLLAQQHVDGPKARADGGRRRPLDADAGALE